MRKMQRLPRLIGFALVLTPVLAAGREAVAQRACTPDTTHRTAYERLQSAPGVAVTEQSRDVATLTSVSNGSGIRILDAVATDAVGGQSARAAIVVVQPRPTSARKVFVDAADLPALERALTAFETARGQGLDQSARQKYTTPGGLEIETFWDGKQRVVAVSSAGPCPMSAYLGEADLARLRDAVAAARSALGAQ